MNALILSLSLVSQTKERLSNLSFHLAPVHATTPVTRTFSFNHQQRNQTNSHVIPTFLMLLLLQLTIETNCNYWSICFLMGTKSAREMIPNGLTFCPLSSMTIVLKLPNPLFELLNLRPNMQPQCSLDSIIMLALEPLYLSVCLFLFLFLSTNSTLIVYVCNVVCLPI